MILVGLGANLPSQVGEPAATLRAALAAMQDFAEVLRVSRFYRTPAWPDPADPPFVNAVAAIATRLEPAALLARLHDIESIFGRVRQAKNAPRTLDLDLLDYNGRVEPGPPTLPHPRIADRAFVLTPLADVAPAWRHPTAGLSVTELLAMLPDEVRQIASLST